MTRKITLKKLLKGLFRGLVFILSLLLLLAVISTVIFRLGDVALAVGNPFEDQLKGKICETWQDTQGIAHARAGNKDLAFACLGYFHGRDRAWQLDFFKRTWEGKKSEVFGASEVRGDFTMRVLGFEERAEAIFAAMPADQKEWLWSYSYGVNRGTSEAMARGSYEFESLGYGPEPWKPQYSIALLLLQAFDQTKESFIRQIDESDYLGDWGDEARKLFSRPGVPWDTTILKVGEQAPATMMATAAARAPRPAPLGAPSGAPLDVMTAKELRANLASSMHNAVGQGSNNWVLSPARSASHHAWLANDPHLELKHPPFWYWSHIESPDSDVIGATLPGVPGTASGANRHIAWGITNSYLNVSSLAYVPEKDLAGNIKTERPVIWIKFGPLRVPFFFKTFSRTTEGWPLLPLDTPAGQALVLRWSGFELTPEDFRGVFELSSAKSAQEADHALSRFGVPSWNFVFADDQGKIGYRAVGRVPGNAEEVPFGIPRRSLAEVRALPAFSHFLTPAEMPHLMNPARGFVATANNTQWPQPSQWRIGRAHAESFRAFRIEELIQATPKHDLESISRTQCDVQAVDARFILPRLLAAYGAPVAQSAKPQDERVPHALQTLRSWDLIANVDCRACPVFQRWLDGLLTDQNLDDTSLYRKLQAPDEDFRKSVREELTGALDDLRVRGSELPTWGQLHLAYFPHMAGFDRFAAKPISTPGDDQSVDPGTSEWEDGVFRHTAGASQRLIVELTSPPRVYSVLAGSNADLENRVLSAPGSAWQRWLKCEHQQREFPLDWSKVQIKRVEL